MTATATNVSIAGVRTPLVFGARYRVRYGTDLVLEDARLESRAANGDLVFVPVGETGDLGTVRVRPSRISAIFGSGVETFDQVEPKREIVRRGLGDILAGRATAASVLDELRLDGSPEPSYTPAPSVASPRRDDETAAAYLERLERGMGSNQYATWIGSDAGQAALASAAAESKVRRLPEPTPLRPDVGDAIVVAGTKYRIRAVRPSDGYAVAVAGPNWKRGPVAFLGSTDLRFDKVASVWRPVDERVVVDPDGPPEPVDVSALLVRAIETAPSKRAAKGIPVHAEPGSLAGRILGIHPSRVTTGAAPYFTTGVLPATLGTRKVGDQLVPDTHNHIWRCAECKRRTRRPECVGPVESPHAPVAAPAGARVEDRVR